MANQNGIVSIAAPLSNHKLNGFKEILNLLSEAKRRGLMKTVSDCCLAKNATFSKRRNKDLPLITKYVVGKERFFLYVEGASSVRNNQDELLLKILVLTFGRNLQFFNCHIFVMFSDRHQLSES